jgi:hypothetical protein
VARRRVSISDFRALPLIYGAKAQTNLSPFYRYIDDSFQCQYDKANHVRRRERFASALLCDQTNHIHLKTIVEDLTSHCISEMLKRSSAVDGWSRVYLNGFVLDLTFKVCD